jgi:hypothetical protein
MAISRPLDIVYLNALEKATEAYQIAMEKRNFDPSKHPLYKEATNIMSAIVNLKALKLESGNRYLRGETKTPSSDDEAVIGAEMLLLNALKKFQDTAEPYVNKQNEFDRESKQKLTSVRGLAEKDKIEGLVTFDLSHQTTIQNSRIFLGSDFFTYHEKVTHFCKAASEELAKKEKMESKQASQPIQDVLKKELLELQSKLENYVNYIRQKNIVEKQKYYPAIVKINKIINHIADIIKNTATIYYQPFFRDLLEGLKDDLKNQIGASEPSFFRKGRAKKNVAFDAINTFLEAHPKPEESLRNKI